MLGLWRRRLTRYLTRIVRALSRRRRRAWCVRPGEWAAANVKTVLKSARGEEHLDEVVTELTRRLAPVLARLDKGAAVLDDSRFARAFQHALNWIAYQEDVTGRGAVL